MEPTFSRRQFLQGSISVVAAALLSPASLAGPRDSEHTIDDYVNALIQIESGGNPRASRYEAHLKDWSYGLGQLLTRTAKDLEKRHPNLPRLGVTPEEIKNSLFDPKINRTYTETLFKEELTFYKDPFLAVAAYNAGHLTPRNARCQQQLNDLYKFKLKTTGVIGKASSSAIKRFQKDNGLKSDGRLGPLTYQTLQSAWIKKFPRSPNPLGIIPVNKYTPNHVRKFKKELGLGD